MLEYRGVNGPHLVVVPKSTLSNWMHELARWAPTLNAVKFHGDKATRDDIISTILEPGQRDEDRDWHVVVTTYEVCNIEKNTLNKFAWSYLIIDEAHRLKNEHSAFSTTIRTFETRYRLLLTGTPLQNNLHELFALLNYLARYYGNCGIMSIFCSSRSNSAFSDPRTGTRRFCQRRTV